MSLANSPFSPHAPALDTTKFRDRAFTAAGAKRARVPFLALRMLWFNTGSVCNLTCAGCYTESSPGNDTLHHLRASEVITYLDEIASRNMPTTEIGFTGGEPFLNREIIVMLEAALSRGFRTLVMTNGTAPMRRFEADLLGLRARFGDRLTVRVSIDHHQRSVHEAERGLGSWAPALDGLSWLAGAGFSVAVASRRLPGETDAQSREGYRALFQQIDVDLDVDDIGHLGRVPAVDADADTPEISEQSWSMLGKSPASVMCANSRMVVRRRGEPLPRVVACVLHPYDLQFDLGATLHDARRAVVLNHPHCARFCVLGGASCGF